MKRLLLSSVFLACVAGVAGAQTAGIMPDWEVRDAAAALQKHTKVIAGLLDQLRPQDWVAQGAPALYVEQLKKAKEGDSYLADAAQNLGQQPDKLSVALDVFFRLDYLRELLDSLTEGTRRHQNAALADLLSAATTQNAATRERLKEYARELAVEREKEWQIANQEAQRCRGILAKRPPRPSSPKKPAATKP